MAADLSRQEPAAKPFGVADEVLHRVIVACLSGHSLEQELPDEQYEVEGQQLSSSTLRLLRRIYEDEVCSEASWPEVSDWLENFVYSRLSQNEGINRGVLRDLVALERSFDNPIKVFAYAQMALEKYPDDGMLYLVKLQVAAKIGDRAEIDDAVADLERLSAEGKLRPLEARLFARAKEALEN